MVGRLISGTAWEEMPAADVDKLKEGAVLGYNMTGCLEVNMQVHEPRP